ncbi:MAG: PRC-barrel domain-containing protein [Steroidobacteraceae bacterium]
MKQLQGWSMVLALSVAGAVLAQTQTKPETTPERTQPDSATTSTGPTEGTAADSTPPGERATGDAARIAATGDAKVSAHRASKIIGMKVQTPAGESVGEVKDIVIDDNGRISQLIVDRASKAGARSGLVSVPWSMASSMIKGSTLVMEQARLDEAPSFDETT